MSTLSSHLWIPLSDDLGSVCAIARIHLTPKVVRDIDLASECVESGESDDVVVVADIKLIAPASAPGAFQRLRTGSGELLQTERLPESVYREPALAVTLRGVAVEIERTWECVLRSAPIAIDRVVQLARQRGEHAMAQIVPPELQDLVERMKAEILSDMADGRVPASVRRFCDLHDHVDANLYGGTTVEPWSAHPEAVASTPVMDLINAAQDEVDAWLRAGRPKGDVATAAGGPNAG